ncbi:hypothetical protein J6590_016434 [Homalodisca vitripennis]|nr:hypothetical protein J6590_016434 [Homalodisca vitripennis]
MGICLEGYQRRSNLPGRHSLQLLQPCIQQLCPPGGCRQRPDWRRFRRRATPPGLEEERFLESINEIVWNSLEASGLKVTFCLEASWGGSDPAEDINCTHTDESESATAASVKKYSGSHRGVFVPRQLSASGPLEGLVGVEVGSTLPDMMLG